MTSGIALWTVLLFAPETASPVAPSQAPLARARLELRSPPNCATADDFVARVADRSPRIQFVRDAATTVIHATFDIGRSGGVSAELILVDSGVERAPRRFVARSCSEAASALAVIVAVALDPDWLDQHPLAPAGDSDADASKVAAPAANALPHGTRSAANGPGEASTAVGTTASPARPIPPPSVAAPSATPAGNPSSTVAIAAPMHVGAFIAGQSLWGPAPAPLRGIAVYIAASLDRGAPWSPAIVLGAFHASRDGLAESGGMASFALDAGTLDACALRVPISVLNLRACASVVVGRLGARGSDTDQPASVARLFAVAGVAGVISADLGRRVEVSARLGTGMTLRRDSYEFASSVFHRASLFTSSVSVGVGWRFR